MDEEGRERRVRDEPLGDLHEGVAGDLEGRERHRGDGGPRRREAPSARPFGDGSSEDGPGGGNGRHQRDPNGDEPVAVSRARQQRLADPGLPDREHVRDRVAQDQGHRGDGAEHRRTVEPPAQGVTHLHADDTLPGCARGGLPRPRARAEQE